MAQQPCSNCRQRFPGKAATVYLHWGKEPERESRTAKLCFECLMKHVSPLGKHALIDLDVANCCSCGLSLEGQKPTTVYIYAYLPKQEPYEFAVASCDEHADDMFDMLADLGPTPPDLGPGGERGPAPHPGQRWEAAW